MPSGGVTLKRRCTYRPSVIYFFVNKLLSLSLSADSPAAVSLSLSLPAPRPPTAHPPLSQTRKLEGWKAKRVNARGHAGPTVKKNKLKG